MGQPRPLCFLGLTLVSKRGTSQALKKGRTPPLPRLFLSRNYRDQLPDAGPPGHSLGCCSSTQDFLPRNQNLETAFKVWLQGEKRRKSKSLVLVNGSPLVQEETSNRKSSSPRHRPGGRKGGGGGSAGLFSVPPSHGWSRVMVTVGGNPCALGFEGLEEQGLSSPGQREGGRQEEAGCREVSGLETRGQAPQSPAPGMRPPPVRGAQVLVEAAPARWFPASEQLEDQLAGEKNGQRPRGRQGTSPGPSPLNHSPEERKQLSGARQGRRGAGDQGASRKPGTHSRRQERSEAMGGIWSLAYWTQLVSLEFWQP